MVDDGIFGADMIALRDGTILLTHGPGDCAGAACCVHNPSDHHMAGWQQVWRADRKIMERMCPHGIGHPDPDDLAFRRLARLDAGVHGCDGCCVPPAESSGR